MTATWLERRRTGIGGSDAAPVSGVGLWASPLSVYLEKIGEAEEREPTERMRWGNLLEGIVGREFAEREGITKLRKPGFRRHPDIPHWIGNPDFTGVDPRNGPVVIEVKVSEVASDWMADEDATMVPLQYFLQVQHYLGMTGFGLGYLAVLVKGSTLKGWAIPRDPEVIDGLRETYAEFWQHVTDRIPPDPDGSEATAEALRRMYRRDDGTERVATPEEAGYASQVIMAREAVRQAEGIRDSWEAFLKASMQSTTRLLIPGGSVSWKQNKPSTIVNWEAIANAYRGMLDEVSQRTLGLKFPYTPDDLDAIVSLHSGEREGARPLRITLKEEQG